MDIYIMYIFAALNEQLEEKIGCFFCRVSFRMSTRPFVMGTGSHLFINGGDFSRSRNYRLLDFAVLTLLTIEKHLVGYKWLVMVWEYHWNMMGILMVIFWLVKTTN